MPSQSLYMNPAGPNRMVVCQDAPRLPPDLCKLMAFMIACSVPPEEIAPDIGLPIRTPYLPDLERDSSREAKARAFSKTDALRISHRRHIHGLPARRQPACRDSRCARTLGPPDAINHPRVQLLGERIRVSSGHEDAYAPGADL